MSWCAFYSRFVRGFCEGKWRGSGEEVNLSKNSTSSSRHIFDRHQFPCFLHLHKMHGSCVAFPQVSQLLVLLSSAAARHMAIGQGCTAEPSVPIRPLIGTQLYANMFDA